MDLAVRRDALGVREHQRVQRPLLVLGALEHPGDPGCAGPLRERGQCPHEGPVQRLGVRPEGGARLAEVAGERLGQHHEVGVEADRAERLQGRAVLGRVEAGGTLDETNPELIPELILGLIGHGPTLPAGGG